MPPESKALPPTIVAGRVVNRNEMGRTGSRWNDYLPDELVPELTHATSVQTYRKMRRSDPTVAATMRSIQLPIRQGTYDIAPPTEATTEEQEQTKFIHDCIFNKLDFNRNLIYALTCLDYGASVFEKVYTRVDSKIVPYKLGFRPLITLEDDKRDNKGELTHIEQRVDGFQVLLKRQKLIIFTVDSETPDDWRGTSLLRPAYKPYYIKERIEIMTGIGHERFTAGVIVANAPEGVKEGDENWVTADKALEMFNSGVSSRLLVPFGWEVKTLERRTNPMNPIEFIKELKDDIKTAPLALHLRLGGNDASGSKALGVTFVDSFLHGVQAWGDLICEGFNKDLIRELIDLNYGYDPNRRYPRLTVTNIYKAALTQLAYLVQVGIIEPSEEVVKYVLEQYGINIDPSKVKPGRGSNNMNNNNNQNSGVDNNAGGNNNGN